jgi:hypothetical protein
MEAAVIMRSDYSSFRFIDIDGKLISKSTILIKIANSIVYRRVDTVPGLRNDWVSEIPDFHIKIVSSDDCIVIDETEPRNIADVALEKIIWSGTCHDNTWFCLVYIKKNIYW